MTEEELLARLGEKLYEAMTRLDPSPDDKPWLELSDADREFYVASAEAVLNEAENLGPKLGQKPGTSG